MQGIPSKINNEFVQQWVRPRVSDKRYKHIVGVVNVARRLAEAIGCDVNMAEMGGWLHDACKEWKDTALVEEARKFKIPFGPIEERQGHLLHGPVAAEVARTELGITNDELLKAIAEHTLGNVPMSKLSEVLFLADCLEESRSHDYTSPIWAALDIDDRIDVARAMVTATDMGLLHLMETARAIHPRTIDVRNYYLDRMKQSRSNSSLGSTLES